MIAGCVRCLLALGIAMLVASGLVTAAPAFTAKSLDLDTLSGSQAEHLLQTGQLTSVELAEAYLARIAALNKSGPGVNAVTQISPQAIQEARQADRQRAEGIDQVSDYIARK